jgi:hypothetical protein
MAINFPNSPTLNEEFTAGDRTWIWDGTVWNSKETAFTTPGIPTGGAAGQLLSKINATDYNTEWKTSDGVRVFASAAARNAAIPSPTGGIVAYLNDSNSLQVYDGAAWTAAGGVSSGNAIINGAFDIWQRGNSVTVIGNGYGVDRWLSNSGGSHTISRQTTGVPLSSQYVARVTAPTGGTTNLFQLIETSNVRPLWGKTVTLSGKIRRNATLTQNMSVVISKNSTVDAGIGTSGWALVNSQTLVNATMPTATGSGDWLSFSLTAVIPSDGTANSLYVGFNSGTMPSGAYYEIAEIQLEAGAVATPFKRNAPSIQAELAACQRYYEKSYDLSVAPGTNTNIGSQMLPPYNPSNDLSAYTVNFQVEKRAAPTMSLYAPDGTINRVHIVDAGVNTSTNTTARDVGTRGFRGWLAGGTSGAPSDKRTLLHYTASAEL